MLTSRKEIVIDPHCIFCGEATDNVVVRAFSSSKPSGGLTQITTSAIPFPAHPACLEKYEAYDKKWKLIWNISIAIFIGVMILIFIGSVALFSSIVGGMAFTFVFFVIGLFAVGKLGGKSETVERHARAYALYHQKRP